MTYQPGDIVKYSKPLDQTEADMRFVVIEDRDTRLLVGLIGAIGLGSSESCDKSEYEPA